MTEHWRGIMPIVATPFDERGALDEAGLHRLVDFCIEAGANTRSQAHSLQIDSETIADIDHCPNQSLRSYAATKCNWRAGIEKCVDACFKG